MVGNTNKNFHNFYFRVKLSRENNSSDEGSSSDSSDDWDYYYDESYDSDDDDDRINKYKDSILYQESELHFNIFLRRRCNRVHSRIENFIKSYEKNNTISEYCVLALLRSIKKEVRYFK